MTRTFLAGLAAAVAIAVLSGTGCQNSGVGDPCTPEEEYSASFLGFDEGEVSVEAESFQCRTRLCLVNHFQGRVSCPYGQNANGSPMNGTTSCNGAAATSTGDDASAGGDASTLSAAAGCCIPFLQTPVTGLNSDGTFANADSMAAVPPQCSNRTAADAVYCSCRCANVNGQTNDGFNYCSCPDGFTCTQLVSSIGAQANGTQLDQGLTGAYCIKNGTTFDANLGCPECSATPTPNCGDAQGATAGH